MNTHFNKTATALVALVLASGCQRDHLESTLEPRSIRTHVARAQEVPVEVIASGAIEAIGKADIAFQVPGRVVSVEIADGALVRQGQLLARLDPADFEKNLTIAEAQFEEVKSRHARLGRMRTAGSLTETDFDKINAALKQTRSAADLARRQLGYTELRAPFDGWIEKRGIEVGVVVAPALPAFTLRSSGAVWGNLGVAETDIGKVRVGQTVEVRVPATRAAAQRGTVEAVLPNADLLSRAFTVKVRLENPRGELRHGNVIVGRILTGERRSAITVPPQVVQKHPDGSLFVWSIDPARKTAVRQIVVAGGLHATEVEIVSGLKDGDQVILNVPHTLFEGARLSLASSP
ncbi:MAG: efflux RND transporter periplasmic adaptor subunit [Verrucomicrobia bacterium]|nr:efflux RND transporter periplasmic adaptor subunit [Verrucomicrobiota bacterium]